MIQVKILSISFSFWDTWTLIMYSILIFYGIGFSASFTYVSNLLPFSSVSSVQSLSHVQLFSTPWIAACQASLSITTPGVYSNSSPSSRWCHPAISSSVVPLSSCPQSLLGLFAWGGQSTGVSALASVLPMNTQDWSLGWTGWTSLKSKGLSRVFSNTT